jgi:hypothetical protein
MNIYIFFAAMVSFGFAQDWLTAHHERRSFPLTLVPLSHHEVSLSKGLQLRLRRIGLTGAYLTGGAVSTAVAKRRAFGGRTIAIVKADTASRAIIV